VEGVSSSSSSSLLLSFISSTSSDFHLTDALGLLPGGIASNDCVQDDWMVNWMCLLRLVLSVYIYFLHRGNTSSTNCSLQILTEICLNFECPYCIL
jgi:hypothetical protein